MCQIPLEMKKYTEETKAIEWSTTIQKKKIEMVWESNQSR